ncbi:uncharacterized protein LOC129942582 [Eupeodes corollae]|uniref:uncharacterized protein LOC129942582 n=1 Tax=Eupeodes corollae TaxID=290404 RepID=UPI00249146F3|nr:uncharacterized protein LOC129942582 [Eupeodes corollae]
MESSIDLFLGNSEEENPRNVALMRKNIRDHSNPLELPNKKFISYFRLNKDAFVYVLNEIKDHLKQPQRSSAIPPIFKLCTALRFMAEGSYQKCSGNDFNLGLAQPTVSVVLKEVLEVVEELICPQWLKARMTNDEMNLLKIHFLPENQISWSNRMHRWNSCSNHSTKKNLQHLYLNRKGYYSLNVMIVSVYAIFSILNWAGLAIFNQKNYFLSDVYIIICKTYIFFSIFLKKLVFNELLMPTVIFLYTQMHYTTSKYQLLNFDNNHN